MQRPIRISAVSYLNTQPLLAGLEHHETAMQFVLFTETPAQCAERLMAGEADLGLVPVAAMERLPGYRPITNYGIAAEGAVTSVLLVSEVPPAELESVYLDYQSQTSNTLMQILLSEYFQREVIFLPSADGYEDRISGTTGGLLIGDRALEVLGKFDFQIDLAQTWYDYQGLPFVFARWVGNDRIDSEVTAELEAAFEEGLQQIPTIVEEYGAKYPQVNLSDYLRLRIQYKLTDRHLRGLDVFQEKRRKLASLTIS